MKRSWRSSVAGEHFVLFGPGWVQSQQKEGLFRKTLLDPFGIFSHCQVVSVREQQESGMSCVQGVCLYGGTSPVTV